MLYHNLTVNRTLPLLQFSCLLHKTTHFIHLRLSGKWFTSDMPSLNGNEKFNFENNGREVRTNQIGQHTKRCSTPTLHYIRRAASSTASQTDLFLHFFNFFIWLLTLNFSENSQILLNKKDLLKAEIYLRFSSKLQSALHALFKPFVHPVMSVVFLGLRTPLQGS